MSYPPPILLPNRTEPAGCFGKLSLTRTPDPILTLTDPRTAVMNEGGCNLEGSVRGKLVTCHMIAF